MIVASIAGRELAAAAVASVAGSDSSGGIFLNIGPLFLLSGFVFYAWIFLRYRNIDKRHRHEAETDAKMHDVRADDHRVGSVRDVPNRRMKGANNLQVAGAQQKILFGLLPASAQSIGRLARRHMRR